MVPGFRSTKFGKQLHFFGTPWMSAQPIHNPYSCPEYPTNSTSCADRPTKTSNQTQTVGEKCTHLCNTLLTTAVGISYVHRWIHSVYRHKNSVDPADLVEYAHAQTAVENTLLGAYCWLVALAPSISLDQLSSEHARIAGPATAHISSFTRSNHGPRVPFRAWVATFQDLIDRSNRFNLTLEKRDFCRTMVTSIFDYFLSSARSHGTTDDWAFASNAECNPRLREFMLKNNSLWGRVPQELSLIS